MIRYSKVTLLLSFVMVFVLSCQKEEVNNNDKAFPITLTGEQVGRSVQLNWDETRVSSFEEYIIVRSNEPIPVDFEPTPFSGFVAGRVDEFEENSFRDDAPLLAETLYYQVFVDVGDRLLKSNSIMIDYEITLLNLTPTEIKFNSESDNLYLFDGNTRELSVFNYKEKEITGSIELNFSTINFETGFFNGQEELYVSLSSTVRIYAVPSMELKEEFGVNGTVIGLDVNDNGLLFIGTNSFPSRIDVYDRATLNVVESADAISNKQLIKVLNNETNEVIAVSFSEIELLNFDDEGNFESSDLTFSNGFFNNKISIMENGSGFIASADGKIFDDDLNDLGLLDDSFGNFFFFEDFTFSTDGTKAYSVNNSFLEVREYRFPEKTVEETYPYNYFMTRIFYDEDQLIFVGNVNDFTGSRTIIELVPLD